MKGGYPVTIQKAVEILIDHRGDLKEGEQADLKDAIELGVRALSTIQELVAWMKE